MIEKLICAACVACLFLCTVEALQEIVTDVVQLEMGV